MSDDDHEQPVEHQEPEVKLDELLEPIFDRLEIDRVEPTENGVTAYVYGRIYEFSVKKDQIIYTAYVWENGDEKGTLLGSSYIKPDEIERVDHIQMSFPIVIGRVPVSVARSLPLPTQPATDVALRLHLVVSGDIYIDHEVVFYKGAGCQVSSDRVIAV